MSFKRFSALLLLAALMSLPALALAQGARTFAVLPFKINGDKYQYMSKGAQTMLSSRLSWLGFSSPRPRPTWPAPQAAFPPAWRMPSPSWAPSAPIIWWRAALTLRTTRPAWT